MSNLKMSRLSFPEMFLNADVKIYEVEDTEADGEKETVVYDGRAYYEHEALLKETSNGRGTDYTGLLVIHGGFVHRTPFKGYAEIDGDHVAIVNLKENYLRDGLYSTEAQLK